MLANIKQRNEGFTIVETLIVLAIAGLIILIVLLAVPALQRNSRNTNIKSDASAISAAINEYESNNGGALPTVTAQAGGAKATYDVGATGTTQATAKIQQADAVNVATSVVPANKQTAGTITIVEKTKCDGTTSPRSTAVYFPVETATSVSTFGNNSNNCIET